LPGVNEDGMKVSAAPIHRRHERRYLHKVGPRARDVDDLEHVLSVGKAELTRRLCCDV